MIDILVTGTGRCGTGFVAKLLTSAGCYCTHEQMFTPYGWAHAMAKMRDSSLHPEWKWRAEASFGAAVYLDRPELKGVTVVHLVRDTKKVIDSMLRRYKAMAPYHGPHFHWLARHIPEIWDWPTPEGRAAYRYLKLNEMCEARADIFHRVEDDPKQLLAKLDINWMGYGLFNDTKYNAHPGTITSDVRLDDLPEKLRWPIDRMTRRYGYEWPKGER